MDSEYTLFNSQNGEGNSNAADRQARLKGRFSVHQIVYPDDDDASTIDENYDVPSITSSIEDQLT